MPCNTYILYAIIPALHKNSHVYEFQRTVLEDMSPQSPCGEEIVGRKQPKGEKL